MQTERPDALIQGQFVRFGRRNFCIRRSVPSHAQLVIGVNCTVFEFHFLELFSNNPNGQNANDCSSLISDDVLVDKMRLSTLLGMVSLAIAVSIRGPELEMLLKLRVGQKLCAGGHPCRYIYTSR